MSNESGATVGRFGVIDQDAPTVTEEQMRAQKIREEEEAARGVNNRAEFFVRASEYASGLDRKFFESHPNASEYYRKAVDGEFGRGDYEPSARVRVRQLSPGVRARLPLGGVNVTDPALMEPAARGEFTELTPEQATALGLDPAA
ncbi:hypothetical protein [Streptomyces sp. NPDC050560]|uniref:hypothetical protein n=1 Tax=Streptomyces sp. NPDC050560 TaxID=3365630 RepID=UPI0037AD7E20